MKTIQKNYIKRIHVNQGVIKANRKNGTNLPPLTIQHTKGPTLAHEVIINGPSRIVHSPHKPLHCGARIWIETRSEVQY